ncbi:MAG: TIGR03854 family LLM class F420-dependent oxidoreductase [Acidimicrobiales bacterium]
MKVRIGFGLGTRSLTNDDRFGPFVDDLERLRFDSLWLSERVGGESPDPVVGMAYAAGRTRRLKFGTSVMVLPGRNPVLVAKALASLDRMSGGRLLPAFGLGVADAHEQQAFGIERSARAGWFDEALPLIRRLWTEDVVDHHGERFHLDGIGVLPKPVQKPLEVWLGGIAPSELRRVGRLGDGWLPSFITATEMRPARQTIEEVANAHGREIDPEHFGALVPYAIGPVPDRVLAQLARRRPDLDPTALVPSGLAALASTIEAFVEHGASKFVVLPLGEPDDWSRHLEEVAAAVLPLQT